MGRSERDDRELNGILITNNPMANQKDFDGIEKIFLESADLLKVLCYTRDKVHVGHKLLTHPLSGSVKPNQTCYKSIMITKDKGPLDVESLRIIENSIAVARTLLDDYQLIDLRLIESGTDR